MSPNSVPADRRELLAKLIGMLRKRHLGDPALDARRRAARKKARQVARASRRANRGTR